MAKVVTAHQWSSAWNRTLERLGLLATGVPTGQGRQRTRIKRIEALAGRVHAEVQEQNQRTCQVTLKFAPLTERAWLQLIESLEKHLQSNAQRNVTAHRTAHLGPEEMHRIEELFREAAPFFTELSALLLPNKADEIAAECTCCPAGKTACPGCELVYRQVGAMLDEEPILLLRLRGREWQSLQQALQLRRKPEYLGAPVTSAAQNGQVNGTGALSPQAMPSNESLERSINHFWGSRKALEALHYYIAPPAIELALLRRLGPLPAMLDDQGERGAAEQTERGAAEHDLAQAMAKVYRQVTNEAQALAYSLDTTEQNNPPEQIEPAAK